MTLVMLPSGTGKFGYFVFRGYSVNSAKNKYSDVFGTRESVINVIYVSVGTHANFF